MSVLSEAAAMDTDIDGDVLVYLEMAQVKLQHFYENSVHGLG